MESPSSDDRMYFTEKPAKKDIDQLVSKYRNALERIVTWDRREVDFRREMEDPPCFGEVILLITDDEERLALVRGRGSPPGAFDLPTGIIEEGEGVEATALREGYEESGNKIQIEALTAIYRVQVRFAKWDVERWFFSLRCSAQSPSDGPKDTEEIEEVRFVRLPEEAPAFWGQEEWWGSNWREEILRDASFL
ncbi:MAG: NUDIX hydrolase [Thermoplasmata archaeon]